MVLLTVPSSKIVTIASPAKRLSDEIGIIIDGRLIEIEKTRKIFTNPNNPNTKAFVNGDLV